MATGAGASPVSRPPPRSGVVEVDGDGVVGEPSSEQAIAVETSDSEEYRDNGILG